MGRRVLRDKQIGVFIALTIAILTLLVVISAQVYVATTPPPQTTNLEDLQAYSDQIRNISVLASIALLICLIFLIIAVGLLSSSLSYIQEAALSSDGTPEWMPTRQHRRGDTPEQIEAPPPTTPAWRFTRAQVAMFIVIFIIVFLIAWYVSTLLFRGG